MCIHADEINETIKYEYIFFRRSNNELLSEQILPKMKANQNYRKL